MLGERENPKPKELQESLKHDMGIDVDVHAARKAMSEARKDNDDEDACFKKLPGLFEDLKEQNPGTVAEIAMDEGRLSMAFLCPGPCARAWSHCPKIMALDGTHGSSLYQGVILVATAMDGAGQIFPLAFCFAPSETNNSWRFLVRNLADALHIRDTPLTVISDRRKGIDNIVAAFIPRAAHAYCAFHVHQNMMSFGKAAADLVNKLARASSLREYNDLMNALGNISPDARENIIEHVPREQLVRVFSHCHGSGVSHQTSPSQQTHRSSHTKSTRPRSSSSGQSRKSTKRLPREGRNTPQEIRRPSLIWVHNNSAP